MYKKGILLQYSKIFTFYVQILQSVFFFVLIKKNNTTRNKVTGIYLIIYITQGLLFASTDDNFYSYLYKYKIRETQFILITKSKIIPLTEIAAYNFC